uniref:Uncharacterized protein n=1 Tax=Ixodes ricinus TaxID=34613 RepID=A0A6B0U1Y6_IXORI
MLRLNIFSLERNNTSSLQRRGRGCGEAPAYARTFTITTSISSCGRSEVWMSCTFNSCALKTANRNNHASMATLHPLLFRTSAKKTNGASEL